MVSTEDFRKWQRKHYNFMTPDIIKLKQSNNRFVELSRGYSIAGDGAFIYGVTVIIYNPTKDTFETQVDSKLNQYFTDHDKALNHFNAC